MKTTTKAKKNSKVTKSSNKQQSSTDKQNSKSVNQSKSSIKPYEEEESYENPINISRAHGCQDDYIDIRSEYAAAINISLGAINTSHDSEIGGA